MPGRAAAVLVALLRGLCATAGAVAALCAAVLASVPPALVDPRSGRLFLHDALTGRELAVLLAVVPLLAVATGGPGRRAVQAAAAAAALLGTAVAAVLTSLWDFGPQDVCRWAGCWPQDRQTLAASVPGLLLALALVVLALRRRAGPRATAVALAVWLLVVAAHRHAWTAHVLKHLQGPPP